MSKMRTEAHGYEDLPPISELETLTREIERLTMTLNHECFRIHRPRVGREGVTRQNIQKTVSEYRNRPFAVGWKLR